MTHFTDIELQRWKTSGPGPDRPRIVDHVGECAACAARYAEAIRTRPQPEEELAGDVAAFTDAARRIGARQSASTFARLPRWVLPLTAAAAIVGALAIPSLFPRDTGDSTPRLRGAEIRALTPEGALDATTGLAWTSGVAADRFRVEIGDDSGVVYSQDTPSSPLPMPALIANAPPGHQYWWTVTALDRQGQPAITSARRAFSIKPR